MNLLEVLSPAGDWERLNSAVDFGADAVYLGRKNFGMRVNPQNFDLDTLKKAIELCHNRGVKVYVTCNTLPRNNEIPQFQQFVEEAVACNVDALIVADLGLLSLIKKFAPNMEIHMSTQTGIVNYVSANQLYEMGCKRVVLARELSLDEIAEIRAKTPKDLDIEAFVHGAMCMSFSGRCLLSSYFTNRDANRGECAQPCRWNYYLMEEKRKGEYHQVIEDENGSYILNAKDMCMLNHLDDVIKAGVNSLKIEGRAKSSYYVSVVTNAYRQAVDIYKKDPDNYKLPQWLQDEVFKVSHRQYCTGFFYGHPNNCKYYGQYYENGGYIRSYDVVAIVEDYKDGILYCTQRNKFLKGAEVEILAPLGKPVTLNINEIINEDGESVDMANHSMMKFSFKCDIPFPKNSIIRMKKD